MSYWKILHYVIYFFRTCCQEVTCMYRYDWSSMRKMAYDDWCYGNRTLKTFIIHPVLLLFIHQEDSKLTVEFSKNFIIHVVFFKDRQEKQNSCFTFFMFSVWYQESSLHLYMFFFLISSLIFSIIQRIQIIGGKLYVCNMFSPVIHFFI